MALNLMMAQELCARLKPGQRIAAMGYPDLTMPVEFFEEALGDKFVALQYRKDSLSICKRHGIYPVRDVPDAASFFSLLGARLDVFDVIQERGDEIMCDLNEPLPEKYLGQYDFVLDVGTIEHCFNIGQAAKNMAGLLKQGGVILHENPFVMPNHGFYSLNPTWYLDFYEQNGFRLLDCLLCAGNLRDGIQTGRPPFAARFHPMKAQEGHPTTTIFAMAERLQVQDLRWPIQTKYKQVFTAAGLSGEKKEHQNA